MNGLSSWIVLSRALLAAGLFLNGAGAFLFVKNGLYGYLMVRALQKGLMPELYIKEAGAEGRGKNPRRGKGGKGQPGFPRRASAKTQELKGPDGTALLDNAAREKAEQSEKDREWIPASASCRIVKDVLEIHTRKKAANK